MLMHGFAASGQVEAGFDLLVQAEGLLSHCSDSCYPMFQMLLEACRAIRDSKGTSHLQKAVELLGLVANAPVAAVVQDATA